MLGILPSEVRKLKELQESSLKPENHILDLTVMLTALDSELYKQTIEINDPKGGKYELRILFSITKGSINGIPSLFRHLTMLKRGAEGEILEVTQPDAEVVLHHLGFPGEPMVVTQHPDLVGSVVFFQQFTPTQPQGAKNEGEPEQHRNGVPNSRTEAE